MVVVLDSVITVIVFDGAIMLIVFEGPASIFQAKNNSGAKSTVPEMCAPLIVTAPVVTVGENRDSVEAL